MNPVKRELLFHEAMGLVEHHHSGFLDSYESDAKVVKDAAIARLYRAYAIVRAIETQHNEMAWSGRRADGEDTTNRRRLRLEAQRDGVRQIREFAPELMTDYMLVDLNVEFEYDPEDGYEEDFDELFAQARREYHKYDEFIKSEAESARLCHARALLKACDNEGTEANIREARIVAIRQIREFVPGMLLAAFHSTLDSAEYTTASVYSAYRWDIRCRIHHTPSLYDSVRGESAHIRHSEARRMAVYIQDEYDFRQTEQHSAGLMPLVEQAIEKIKSFAPELVPDEADADPWHIIRRVIADTA
jgi:hypothetical protein